MTATDDGGAVDLQVRIDGEALAQEPARALWARFSSHMDANRGDFDGFAAAEGYRSARVAVEQGKPTLFLSSSEQASAPEPGGGGRGGGKRRGRRGGGKRRGGRRGGGGRKR